MAKLIGDSLPNNLLQRLNGLELQSKRNLALQIITVGDDGLPHPALLSYYELAAKNKNNIRLGIYKTSTTSKNLGRNGKITVIMVDKGTVFYIKGQALLLKEEMSSEPSSSLFNLRVQHVFEDVIPTAEILNGINFRDIGVGEPHHEIFNGLFEV